ncbi:MAG TPA: EAL domain-containing protein [Acidimicrobiales bacterium]|nr:EAL domain-containing protein [Acidimicrobiales bacterium]
MGLQQAIATASDPASVMDRVLAEALVLVPSAEGAGVMLRTNADVLGYTAAAGNLVSFVGATVPLANSFSAFTMQSGVTQRSDDMRSDPRIDTMLAAKYGILSVMCVPLARGTEEIGVLLITSGEVSAFGPADEATVAGLAPFLSTVIGAAVDLASCTTELLRIHQIGNAVTIGQNHLGGQSETARARSTFVANVVCPGSAFESAGRDRIGHALAGDGPKIVLQPIVSLSNGMVVEVEALSRFTGPPERGPDRWFAEAAAIGLGHQLELRAIERALSLLPGVPSPIRMAVNAGPETFCSPELIDLLLTSDPCRIVVELTEHVGIENYPALHRACKRLRTIGAEVAIDDTGTGFASLSLVLEVAPEIIKLDRELTADINLDPVKRALASALVTFGAEIGAKVIAEGIETAAELETLTGLGIGYGQGYYLGRPGTIEDLAVLIRAEGVREPIRA